MNKFRSDFSLEDCYAALTPMVRRYVRRHVPVNDVDDVVQVVFLEVWRHQRRYDPARSLEAWVLGIARKRAIDHLRARWRHDRRVVPLDETVTAAVPGRIDADLIDQAQDVRDALAALSPVQREAIELAYFGDLTQREIAERLGTPLGTIKARTARGLDRLGVLLCA
ncbi:sigma-70 family RNA polymerase sigma factor [Actinomadura scrupuli]|uniref:sigma-70 family RNA polymerase sigma factor n=1 Tax=Actinomadura scrupuli TaxID=559629 RepID=UPI003D979B50